MTKLIVIGGYAQGGKSSSLNILEELGCKRYSSSEILHSIGENILKEFFDLERVDFRDKSLNWMFEASYFYNEQELIGCGDYLTSREVLIKLAEKILVPVLGRKNAFVRPLIDKILEEKPECATLETIGGHEWSLMRDELLKYPSIEFITINIRRNSEEPNADYRELLDDYGTIEVHNDGTKEGLKKMLKLIKDGL